MRKLLLLLLAGWVSLYAEVVTDPPECASRPCVYRLRCQAAVCVAGESAELQRVLREAHLGDVIELQAGQTWVGNYDIRRAPGGEGWLTIRTSAVDMLPPSGARVSPSHAANFARIRTPNFVTAILMPDGPTAARNIRFTGIEIFPADTVTADNADLVRVGNITATVVEDLPTNVEFDRCWLHGALAGETRNAINANGRNIIVRDSYISEIKTSIVENHAFVSYNSPGPFTLVNNYIEASAIPILFGGATPAIRTPMLPSGLDMRFNYITKPLKWYRNSPYYEGKQYANKNMLEWKVGGASVVRWNVFEHNFREQRNDQSGAAIAFNVRLPYAQAGEWARTEDIQFTNNIVRRSHSAWSLLGADSNYKFTGLTQRITIRNNLFQEIGKTWDYRDGREYYTTFGRLIAGGRDIVVENNTFHSSEPLNAPGGPGSGLIFDGTSSPKTVNLTYRNNLLPGGGLPFKGDGLGVGGPTLNAKTAGRVEVARNVFAGVNPAVFQTCRSEGEDSRICTPNWFVSNRDWDENVLGWRDAAKGDFRVTAEPYAATAETPAVGADPDQLPQIQNLRVDPNHYGAVLRWNLTQPIAGTPCVMEVSADSGLVDKRTLWRPVRDLDPALFRGADLISRSGNVESELSRVFVVGLDGEEAAVDGTTVDRRLDPETEYYYRLMCAGDLREGSFRTTARPPADAVRDVTFDVVVPENLGVENIIVQHGEKETGAPVDFVSYTDPPIACQSRCTVTLSGVSMRPRYTRILYYNAAGELVGGSASDVIP